MAGLLIAPRLINMQGETSGIGSGIAVSLSAAAIAAIMAVALATAAAAALILARAHDQAATQPACNAPAPPDDGQVKAAAAPLPAEPTSAAAGR